MLAANRQKVLQALGIRSWVRRDRMSASFVNSLGVIPATRQSSAAQAGIHLSDTSVISNPDDILIPQSAHRWIPAFAGMTQEKKTRVVQEEKTEITHEEFVQARTKPFRLILQPLTHNTLIIAALNDPQAPGLSAQEQRLLANICFAMHNWLALENPPALVGEAGLFSWPAQAHASLSVDAEQALQGLLAAQKDKGFTEFLLLGREIEERAGKALENMSHTILPSLHELYHQPRLKKNLWQLMMNRPT